MKCVPCDDVLKLLQNLVASRRRAQQQTTAEAPRLMPALQYRMQKKEDVMRLQKDADSWLPQAREAKLSPMDYMDRCSSFLAKLDTMGWRRSFHQSLFHAVRACAGRPVVAVRLLTLRLAGLHPRDVAVLLQDGEARHVCEDARAAAC